MEGAAQPSLCVCHVVPGIGDSRNASPVLTFVGDLDFSIAPAVRDVLQTISDPDVIDLSAVRYFDAAIINEFVRLAKSAAPKRISLIGVRPQLRVALAALRLSDVFTFADGWICSPRPRLIWKSRIG